MSNFDFVLNTLKDMSPFELAVLDDRVLKSLKQKFETDPYFRATFFDFMSQINPEVLPALVQAKSKYNVSIKRMKDAGQDIKKPAK